MIRRWLRRRAAQRALEAAYVRALDRAVAHAVDGAARHVDAMRGVAIATPELVAELQAFNRETDRLIAIYRRIQKRIRP